MVVRHSVVFAACLLVLVAGFLPLAAQGLPDELILVPDFGSTDIMAFSAIDGEPYDLSFVPGGGHTLVPFDVAEGPVGTILVTGGANDAIHWYSFETGEYLGVFAPFGGVDTAQLDAPRGMFRFSAPDSSNLLVTSSSGSNANAIVEFSGGGDYIGTRVAPGAGSLSKPRDVVKRGEPYNDLLVTANDTAIVHRYDLAGNPLADFASLTPDLTGIHWDAASDTVLVVAYNGTDEGINRFTGAGVFIDRLDPSPLTKYWGVSPLDNGNLLVSTLSGVAEVDLAGNLVEIEADNAGAMARRISLVIPGLIFRDGFESGTADLWD